LLSKLLIILVVLIVGGAAAYAGMKYQQRVDAAVLTEQLAAKDAELAALKTPPEKPKLAILAPLGKEELCRGDDFVISWKTNPLIEQVKVLLVRPGATSNLGSYLPVGNVDTPEGTGAIKWEVGMAGGPDTDQLAYSVPNSQLYKIHIDATGTDKIMQSAESGLFTIKTCP